VRRRRLWPRLAGAVLLWLVAMLVFVWIERRPIATRFIDRELAQRGVPARYTIEALGTRRQRLTNLVIGDPADPDLVADWVEVDTAVGWSGASVTGVRAGHVRMRARLKDGTVSLGAIDRLMSPSSGKPFALPALDAQLQDVRVRLETPQGVVGLKVSGAGRLDHGFAGRLAATAPRLTSGDCVVEGSVAALTLKVSRQQPTIDGPVRVRQLACGAAHARTIVADAQLTLGAALDRWQGRAAFAAAGAGMPQLSGRTLSGEISFVGNAQATTGTASIEADAIAGTQGAARGARIAGDYRASGEGLAFTGQLAAQHARLAEPLIRRMAALVDTGAGTPVAPLAARLSRAAAAAARDSAIEARLAVSLRGSEGAIAISQARLAAASGARVAFEGEGLRYGWPGKGLVTSGALTMVGGGLPEGRIALQQRASGAAITGVATLAPYTADGARLALTPVRFSADGRGSTRIETVATLSGPLGDGRVDAVTLPIDARWRGSALTLNSGCAPLGWQRVAVSGLVLDPARLVLCPTGNALVTVNGGRIGGGVRIAASQLSGRLGSTPVTLAASGSELRLGDSGFRLSGVAARLGAPERVTRIDVGTLTGQLAGSTVVGEFEGAGGQIGNVPLLLSEAAGEWRLAKSVLTLGGRLRVADSATQPRFKPLTSGDVVMTLAGNRIDARGTLTTPKNGATVAVATIVHDLSRGTGHAVLDVPGIQFAEKGLQPDDLTPVTFGVIAEVNGRIEGRGDIAWDGEGVTSTGRFRTAGTDLAAAFGPVTGLSGEIVFTDLLGLVTAPHQVATVASVNPGIPVENGTVRYQSIGDQRVSVEGGEWPFAGGKLVLDPTVLDFNADRERRMTFRVSNADAGQFLQQFDFSNMNATGTFDGALPMIFDAQGGRIENGRLSARSGGNLAYIGELTEKDLGVWGNIAFQALKSLDYRSLDLTLNGALAGEMVTEIRFAGVSQGEGTKSNFLIRRLAKLPFVFNVTVRAPFRQLIDSAQSFYDPKRLIARNLPALLDEQEKRKAGTSPPQPPVAPVQAPESEKRP